VTFVTYKGFPYSLKTNQYFAIMQVSLYSLLFCSSNQGK